MLTYPLRMNNLYFFQCGWRGQCLLEAKTSGRNGFVSPKLFVIQGNGKAWHGSLTLKHSDRHVQSPVRHDEINNVGFLRIAIGQFLQWEEITDGDFKGKLDLTCSPYLGDITNRHGRLISETSFLPKAPRFHS